jgi:hypothetical protein
MKLACDAKELIFPDLANLFMSSNILAQEAFNKW